MSNGINRRQNEENSILKLAAQRQTYTEAKMINRVIFICSVVIPFISSLVSLFITDNKWSSWSKSISIMSWILALFLQMKIKKAQETAALIQQQFDVYVFSFAWDNKLFRKNKNIDYIINQKADRLFKKSTIQNEHLENWYRKEVDKLPLEEGIKLCQEENVNWDNELRSFYRFVSLIMVIILLGIIVFIGIYQSNVLSVGLSFGIPIFQWEMKVLTAIKADIERLNNLSNSINNNEVFELEQLLEIQRDIYEHRQRCYLIDDKIQNILRNKLEKRHKDRVNYDIRNNKNNSTS
ncbi:MULTISPECIES: S-4TM family putative pore-forming effector [unclassified Clostridium]|uniref:S-4TM family putative pore-forming effector n=1 Tax=unclassified Clostridium TaxID=2614128 RepID=UPI0005FBA1CA|nr:MULTISPECIES: S-4TM family putative pore-forming effector [unclassified Clostridium]